MVNLIWIALPDDPPRDIFVNGGLSHLLCSFEQVEGDATSRHVVFRERYVSTHEESEPAWATLPCAARAAALRLGAQLRKVDADNRADVQIFGFPNTRLRYAVLSDREAERVRRRLLTPSAGWNELTIGRPYGTLGHVFDNLEAVFCVALWVCRGRNWDNFPDLRVIWDSNNPPNSWVLDYQPQHITEEN